MIFAGMGGAIDIDLRAVELVIDRLKVKNPDSCFKKVVAAARNLISEHRKE